MRIADVTEFYSPRGGVRLYLTIKGRALRALAHDHLVVAPADRDGEVVVDVEHAHEYAGTARVVSIAGPALPYDSQYHLLWRLDRVRQAIREFAPDVVCVNSLYLAALAVGTMPSTNKLIKVVNWHSNFIESYLQQPITEYLPARVAEQTTAALWQLVRNVLNQFMATFVASHDQAEKLRRLGVRRVIEVPYGVDRSVFTPQARDLEFRRTSLDAEPGALLLVAVGRLSVEKGWDLVLDAFTQVRERRRAKLLIFGDGPERERLRSKAPVDCVTFMGFQPERARLAAALASADLFIHGGTCETYGFSVAEAVACGIPVVVPGAGAARDLVDSSHAATYAPTSAQSFAEAIEAMIGDEREQRRERAVAASSRVPDCYAQVSRLVEEYRLLQQTAQSLSSTHVRQT